MSERPKPDNINPSDNDSVLPEIPSDDFSTRMLDFIYQDMKKNHSTSKEVMDTINELAEVFRDRFAPLDHNETAMDIAGGTYGLDDNVQNPKSDRDTQKFNTLFDNTAITIDPVSQLGGVYIEMTREKLAPLDLTDIQVQVEELDRDSEDNH